MSTFAGKSLTNWLEDELSSVNRNITSDWTFEGSATFEGGASLDVVAAQPATELTPDYSGKAASGWFKVTVPYTAWTAAAQTEDMTVATLPAGMKILAAYADTTTEYAGLAGTIGIKVGLTEGGQELLLSHDVKSAPITAGLLYAELGDSLGDDAVQGGCIPDWADESTINVRLSSGTGNIGADGETLLTAGSTTFYFKLEQVK